MNNMMLRLAVVTLGVMAATACDKRDSNSITGSTDYTSVSLGSDPTSFTIPVGDSAEFTPTATIEPQGVAIGNATANMTFSFADPDIAEVNASGFVQGDAVGSTTLTITYTDVNHNFATSTLDVPVTVTGAP
jgi:hypothetical protein